MKLKLGYFPVLPPGPLPWAVEGRGEITAVVDAEGETVFEVLWDGLQEGGVNEALRVVVAAINKWMEAN